MAGEATSLSRAIETIEVLTAISEPLVELGVRTAIESASDCRMVGNVTDPREISARVAAHRPAVVLMDAAYHRADGTLISRLSEAHPATRFVLMVNHSEEECILRSLASSDGGARLTTAALEHVGECCLLALRNGGRGCVPRTASPERLIEAVRAVAAGEISAGAWLSASWVAAASDRVHKAAPSSISGREAEVIRMVGRGLSNKQVGVQLRIAEQTVKNHLSRIMRKLELENRVELAVFARKHGLS
jgi:DNA-binding NarL/FixJ family response regulator